MKTSAKAVPVTHTRAGSVSRYSVSVLISGFPAG